MRFASSKWLFVRSAPERFAPVRSAPVTIAEGSDAPLRSAPTRIASVRSAPASLVRCSLAPVRLAPANCTSLRSRPARSRPVRSAPGSSTRPCTTMASTAATVALDGSVGGGGTVVGIVGMDDDAELQPMLPAARITQRAARRIRMGKTYRGCQRVLLAGDRA